MRFDIGPFQLLFISQSLFCMHHRWRWLCLTLETLALLLVQGLLSVLSHWHVPVILLNQQVCHFTPSKKPSPRVDDADGTRWCHQVDSSPVSKSCPGSGCISLRGKLYPCDRDEISVLTFRCSDMVIDRRSGHIPGTRTERKCGLRVSDSWLRYRVWCWVAESFLEITLFACTRDRNTQIRNTNLQTL